MTPAPKPCARCGKVKGPEAFAVIPAWKPGAKRLHSWCRTCVRIDAFLRREEGKVRAAERAWRELPRVREQRRANERRRYWRRKMAG